MTKNYRSKEEKGVLTRLRRGKEEAREKVLTAQQDDRGRPGSVTKESEKSMKRKNEPGL